MRIGIIGYGGVGRALVKLINDRRDKLSKEGIDLVVNYVLSSRGGVYHTEGIDLEKLVEFSSDNKDITQHPQGGSENVSFDTMLEKKDIDILIEMTPTNLETGDWLTWSGELLFEQPIAVIITNTRNKYICLFNLLISFHLHFCFSYNIILYHIIDR